MFDRGSKHILWTKDSFFNKWCGGNWTNTCRKIIQDYLLTPHTRINWKWIKDLNVRPKTIKILKENIGSKILDIAHSNFLSDTSPQAREIKEKISKWDYIKLKNFCTAKENDNKIKRQPTEWENISADTSDKGLIPKIHKELSKLNTKKTQTTQLKTVQRTWTDTSPKRTYRWPIGIWKDAQHL